MTSAQVRVDFDLSTGEGRLCLYANYGALYVQMVEVVFLPLWSGFQVLTAAL